MDLNFPNDLHISETEQFEILFRHNAITNFFKESFIMRLA